MPVELYAGIWCGRSDGVLEIKTKKHGKEYNGPTANQLDKAANPEDYYEELDSGHSRALEWKRVLAGMLRRERNEPGNDKWILVNWPENYRMYKQVQKHRSPGESSNAARSDSKKSNVSEDYYLYGYPYGRKKRFKSAVDFFPHFLWLIEGHSDDWKECTCKMCAPEWVEKEMAKMKPLPGRPAVGDPPPSKEAPPVKRENVTIKKENVASDPKVVIKQRPLSHDVKAPKPIPMLAPPTAASGPPRAPAQSLIVPSALPPTKSREQGLDAQYGKFIYRSGELTWFNRGSAWGLCVIIKRDLFKNQQNHDKPCYLVQPLSHPFHHPDLKTINTEDGLRPWLAWSAPGPTHQTLAAANLTFQTVDWKGLLDHRYGDGDAEVDGSIYAAKMLDDSFTLTDPLSNNTTTTGERSYAGIFLGGEKIWVGEPIRLRSSSPSDIMVLHQIIEKLKPGSTNASLATVHVVGDVYRYTTVPHTPNASAPETPHLPLRMREDLAFRNRITIPVKHTLSYWKILQSGARLSIADVKGRWYESSILLPILQAANYHQGVQRGEISDVGTWINGRGDTNMAAGKAGTRYKDRLEAIGRAVPQGTRISKGLDGPAEENAFPTPVAAAGVANVVGGSVGQGGQVPAASEGDIADFMNLDGMDEGFGPGYGEQGGQL